MNKLERRNKELSDKIKALEGEKADAQDLSKIVFACTNGHPFKRSTDFPYGPNSKVKCDNCKKIIGDKNGCKMFHHCHVCS